MGKKLVTMLVSVGFFAVLITVLNLMALQAIRGKNNVLIEQFEQYEEAVENNDTAVFETAKGEVAEAIRHSNYRINGSIIFDLALVVADIIVIVLLSIVINKSIVRPAKRAKNDLDDIILGIESGQGNLTLRVFSAYLHMDEATPHLHIDFVPYTTGSRRGIDTRVSLKQALSALGFKGGTRRETELNQWVAYEKEQLAAVMLEHGIEWEKKGTHEKHLSVLDFEKKERAKEVAELEQSISDGKERLSDIQIQHRKAVQETEQIRKKGEAIRQEVSELSETSDLLKEQATTLAEDKKKLLSDNVKLEKQQKKLQQDIEKMVQSKAVMERNIHAYDEDEKWQLPEPAALMSAKAYKDKKAFPLVEKLKETIKALTIKCVQLAEQGKKLKEKVTRQEQQISRLTDKVMEQSDIIDRLQEKTADLGRLERYFGREQVQSIVERSRALEWAEKENKRPKRVFDMSR